MHERVVSGKEASLARMRHRSIIKALVLILNGVSNSFLSISKEIKVTCIKEGIIFGKQSGKISKFVKFALEFGQSQTL